MNHHSKNHVHRDVRKYATVVLCLFILAPLMIFADDEKKPAVRAVSIEAKLIESYGAAQKRTVDAQQLLEKTPEYGAYRLRQSEEVSAMIWVMAESGLKPSEGCLPVFDEKTKALLRFDCPVKKPEKP